MTVGPPAPLRDIRSPRTVLRQVDQLVGRRQEKARSAAQRRAELEHVADYLGIADRVGEALEALNAQLFQEVLGVIAGKLTIALQEVLEQPIALKAEADWKRSSAWVDFWIEREGEKEDIMKGQGGSVANVLSVGLRMFALATLDEREHRRFLVLDEQDCWLNPSLVPRLVKIVHDAGKALGFQVLMISHHDVGLFDQYADKILELIPEGDAGVRVVPRDGQPGVADELQS